MGNLTQRQDLRSGTLTQNFCYDGLNRLKASRFGSCSSSNTDFTYDALGNITSKLGMGNYSYGAGNAGPHAVTNAGGVNYTYDNNGRMLTGDGRTVSYTPFGKPKHMARGSNAVHIAYGPSQNRIERVDTGVKSATTTYVGGLYEKEISGGYTTHTHYLGDFALYIAKSSSAMNEERMVYLHRDHIGSIAAKTDMVATGNANAEFMANGPWGVRTQDKWNGSLLGDNFVPDDTARGFTNHEHLDGVGLVHMNGRVYEPSLGRFLSPDLFVNDPLNTQSFNRYSYVLNNPLTLIDPTGFIEEIVVYGDSGGGRDCNGAPGCVNAERPPSFDFSFDFSSNFGSYNPPSLDITSFSGNQTLPQFATTSAESDGKDDNGEGGDDSDAWSGDLTGEHEGQGIQKGIERDAFGNIKSINGEPIIIGAAPNPRVLALAVAVGGKKLIEGTKNFVKNVSVDGPQAKKLGTHGKGRIFQLRWKKDKFIIRLDLHPLPGSKDRILHINYGASKGSENNHLKIFNAESTLQKIGK